MTSVTEPSLRYEAGRITRLVFNRPHVKNALDAETWALLDESLSQFQGDTSARVLVISGANSTFSAGADLNGGINSSPAQVAAKMREIAATVVRLHSMPKPTVAQVDGDAVGAGMSIALACDLVIASGRARVGAVFSRVGLTPDCGLSWLLPRMVGPHRAKELALTGRLVESSEALTLGLVNAVVPADELGAVTDLWCEQLASCPPAAAAGTLRLLDGSWDSTLGEALEHEAIVQQAAVAALRG